MKVEKERIIWKTLIVISILIGLFGLMNPHFVKVKVHKIDIIGEEFKHYRVSWFSGYGDDDFILDTLTYKCIGNREVEDSLDIDKSQRCNENKSVYSFNYFHNRMIEKIAPEIASAIRSVDPLRFLKYVLKSDVDVLNYPDLIKLLSVEEKIELELWFFEIFGSGVYD